MSLHRVAALALVLLSITGGSSRAEAQRFVEDARIGPPASTLSFGRAIAIDGSILAVGAPEAGDGSGAVAVYDVSTTSAPLLLSRLAVTTRGFGASVAVRGDLIAIGAPGETIDGHLGCGAVYVYRRVGGAFTTVGQIRCPSLDGGTGFGAAIAFAGDRGLAVGSPGESRAYYFPDVLLPAGFTSISVPGSRGGGAIAASLGAVGAIGRPIVIVGSSAITEAVDVIAWAPSVGLASEHVLTIVNEGDEPSFGASVAIDGPRVIVGAPASDVAYVYGPALDLMSVLRLAALRAPTAGVSLGASVAVRGRTIAIGATGLGGTTTDDEGSVLVHDESLLFAVRRAVRRTAPGARTVGNAMAIDGSGNVLAVSAVGSNEVFLFVQREATVCTLDEECDGERCIDGVCCDTACGEGDPDDCVACDLARAPGWCLPRIVGATCGPAGACEGRCDGESAACFVPATCEVDGGADVDAATPDQDAAMSMDDGSVPFDGGPPPPPGISFSGGGGCRCAAIGAGATSHVGASMIALALALTIGRRRTARQRR